MSLIQRERSWQQTPEDSRALRARLCSSHVLIDGQTGQRCEGSRQQGPGLMFRPGQQTGRASQVQLARPGRVNDPL